jgi:hypothetical protein
MLSVVGVGWCRNWRVRGGSCWVFCVYSSTNRYILAPFEIQMCSKFPAFFGRWHAPHLCRHRHSAPHTKASAIASLLHCNLRTPIPSSTSTLHVAICFSVARRTGLHPSPQDMSRQAVRPEEEAGRRGQPRDSSAHGRHGDANIGLSVHNHGGGGLIPVACLVDLPKGAWLVDSG